MRAGGEADAAGDAALETSAQVLHQLSSRAAALARQAEEAAAAASRASESARVAAEASIKKAADEATAKAEEAKKAAEQAGLRASDAARRATEAAETSMKGAERAGLEAREMAEVAREAAAQARATSAQRQTSRDYGGYQVSVRSHETKAAPSSTTKAPDWEAATHFAITTVNVPDRLDLAANSPCLDAGNNKQVPEDIADLDGDYDIFERMPLDIAGNGRFVDNTAAANKGVADPPTYPSIVDMGAYEYAR